MSRKHLHPLLDPGYRVLAGIISLAFALFGFCCTWWGLMAVTTCREYFDLYLKHDQCLPSTVSSLSLTCIETICVVLLLIPLSKVFYHKTIIFLSDHYFHIKKYTWQNECLLCQPVSNGLFVDAVRKCAFCFPAPVAVLQIKITQCFIK